MRWGGPVLAGWFTLALATAQSTDVRAQPVAPAMPALSKAERALQDAAEKLVIQAAKKLGQTPPRADARLVVQTGAGCRAGCSCQILRR